MHIHKMFIRNEHVSPHEL